MEHKKANQITTNFNETYNNKSIKGLDLDLKHSNVKIKEGKTFKVLSKGSNEKIKIHAKVKNGNLTVSDHKGQSNVDISFLDMRYNDMTIYVPQDLENLKVHSDDGSTTLNDINADKAQLNTDVMDLTINDSKFNQLVASGDTSDIKLNKTQFQHGDFKTDTGDILMKDTPADKPKNSQIEYSSDTGNLNIEDKQFENKKVGNGHHVIMIKTDTGDALIK
ncbi:hypothetical protein BUZ75_07865 [Staphylococcus saprophyticus]|nr:hypothetical protein BUZ75_07865 [Staphylococcus saprophyticus]